MKFWKGRNCKQFHFFPPTKKKLTNRDFWERVERASAEIDWLPIVITLLLIGLLVWGVVQCL